jgi:hypothetical protein
MRIGVALLLLLQGNAAWAQAPAATDTINVCRQVVAAVDRPLAQGRAVAGADYVPGVDARGNAVAPADLNRPLQLPDELVLPIAPDLFARAGRTPPRGFPEMRAQLGEVRIRLADGTMTFNGQKLGPAADAELVQACRDLLAREAAQPVAR